MQIQQQPSDSDSDPHLRDHPSNMKVKLEIPKQGAMAPSRSLPRSASELGDPASPFSSNPSHHPVTMPSTTPGLSSSSCSSFGRMSSPPTDSPPITPTKSQSQGGKQQQQPTTSNNKPAPTPAAAAAAAYYASLWSPRRLMQRAARAFRRSRSRGKVVAVRTVKDLADERASVLSAASSSSNKVSDDASAAAVEEAAAVLPPAGADEIAAGGNGDLAGAVDDSAAADYHHEIVPEKIIHEDAPLTVAAAEEKDTAAAPGSAEEVEVESPATATAPEPESPKKGSSPAEAPEPESPPKKVAAEDKFVAVVKEAMKAEQTKDGEAMMGRFEFRAGSRRVRTAMEARPESEQPRRREAAPRSNDVIEEACTKLLEKRQCSRVKALAAAFETFMDNTSKEVAAANAGKPQHRYRRSA